MRAFVFVLIIAGTLAAQTRELGFTLGGFAPRETRGVDVRSGVAFQFNYGQRLWKSDAAAVFAEVHLLASPLRNVESRVPTAVRDVATLYLTPGIRVQFRPEAAVRPWVSGGFGYGQYHTSELLQHGAASPVRDRQHTWAGAVGGGIDGKLFGPIAWRGEIRHWWSPTPRLNVPGANLRNHTVVSGGFVIRL